MIAKKDNPHDSPKWRDKSDHNILSEVRFKKGIKVSKITILTM